MVRLRSKTIMLFSPKKKKEVKSLYRMQRCVHNKAIYPEMGTICSVRKPHTLCADCKMYSPPTYPWYCCQKCGEPIGLLGRIVEFVLFGLIKHKCKDKPIYYNN